MKNGFRRFVSHGKHKQFMCLDNQYIVRHSIHNKQNRLPNKITLAQAMTKKNLQKNNYSQSTRQHTNMTKTQREREEEKKKHTTTIRADSLVICFVCAQHSVYTVRTCTVQLQESRQVSLCIYTSAAALAHSVIRQIDFRNDTSSRTSDTVCNQQQHIKHNTSCQYHSFPFDRIRLFY